MTQSGTASVAPRSMEAPAHLTVTGRQPPIVTHDLLDDAADPILKHLRHRALFNAQHDPVKVILSTSS